MYRRTGLFGGMNTHVEQLTFSLFLFPHERGRLYVNVKLPRSFLLMHFTQLFYRRALKSFRYLSRRHRHTHTHINWFLGQQQPRQPHTWLFWGWFTQRAPGLFLCRRLYERGSVSAAQRTHGGLICVSASRREHHGKCRQRIIIRSHLTDHLTNPLCVCVWVWGAKGTCIET